MALSKIDVANMVTGAVPVANGGTALTSGFVNGSDPRPTSKPIIYNGDMGVAQRGTSFTGVSSGSNWPVDRFEFYPTNLGAYTIIQEALTSGEAYNNGFRTALRIDTTTADASPASTDYAILRAKLEGKDLGLFKKGTSNAEKFTLAFWVKSNKTTTGQVNLFDIDNDRLVSGTYAISSANTWEKKIINFPADTTGGFDNDNALSLIVEFFLDSGSNFSSGTAPTAWEAQTNADRNANNFAIGSSTDNDFALTGVQLEVGEFSSTTIPPFQFETFGDNLQRCKRYFQIFMNSSTSLKDFLDAHIHDNDSMRAVITFPLEMRTTPTLTSSSSGSADHWRYISSSINTNYGSAMTGDGTNKSYQFTLNDTGGTDVSSHVDDPGYLMNNATSCFLKLDAEL
jgi:hypothetical protein